MRPRHCPGTSARRRAMTTYQTGGVVTRSVRRDGDGTWSATVWSTDAEGFAADVRRKSGYLTRRAAREANINETPAQTNRRVHPDPHASHLDVGIQRGDRVMIAKPKPCCGRGKEGMMYVVTALRVSRNHVCRDC